MHRKLGFTLIELLVVIAIITILASIVVPRVTDWIARGRMTRAVSEIRGAELALTQMLADAERQNLRQLFDPQYFPDAATLGNMEAAVELYTNVFYVLLRQGRNGQQTLMDNYGIRLHDDVRGRLASSYMDLGQDPWGNLYRIWPGPWNRQMERTYGPDGLGQFAYDPILNSQRVAIPFRSYREGFEDDVTGEFDPYFYTIDRRQEAEQRVPGNPRADGRAGFPAPADLPVYIYSRGVDTVTNQNYWGGGGLEENMFDAPMDIENIGGGDDINNWDNEQGWSRFYTN